MWVTDTYTFLMRFPSTVVATPALESGSDT